MTDFKPSARSGRRPSRGAVLPQTQPPAAAVALDDPQPATAGDAPAHGPQTGMFEPAAAPPSTCAVRDAGPEADSAAAAQQATDRLWDAYKLSRSVQIRNELVRRHMHLVRYFAERVHNKLTNHVELDDLVASGMFGLIQAVETFRPELGHKFGTHAMHRILGSIYDELRSLDWAPRLVRSRVSKVQKMASTFEARHGRKPSREELFDLFNVSRDEFERILQDASPPSVTSLDQPIAFVWSGRPMREVDLQPSKGEPGPEHAARRAAVREFLLKRLEKQERTVALLYYYEGMTMREIGHVLNLSESRISQINSELVVKLRAALKDRPDELAG